MLEISHLPLLRIQREIYETPRGPARFRRYLELMTDGKGDLALPLSVFNPMGRGHVIEALDALIALDAEGVAARAIEEARGQLPEFDARFEVGIVLVDDLGGGWTNRYCVEIENRTRPRRCLKRGWAVSPAWTSELQTASSIRRGVLATIHRNAWIEKYGEPGTLREILICEGLAAAFSGEDSPHLDAEELEYTREVIRPHLEATDLATILPALFGDGAARSVGNRPLGLSDRAGFALARDMVAPSTTQAITAP